MISEINYEFCNKFPKVYSTAETYGFTQDDIQNLIDVLKGDNQLLKFYSNESHLQSVLKMLIIRLNLSRNNFFANIFNRAQLNYWNQDDFEDASKEVGRYALPAFVTLINNRDKLK